MYCTLTCTLTCTCTCTCRMPPKVVGDLACQKYHCAVCDAAIISYDLKNHYISNTNFEQLELLGEGKEEKLVVAQLGEIGLHTRYMVAHGFTRVNLPSYRHHRMEKKVQKGPKPSASS